MMTSYSIKCGIFRDYLNGWKLLENDCTIELVNNNNLFIIFFISFYVCFTYPTKFSKSKAVGLLSVIKTFRFSVKPSKQMFILNRSLSCPKYRPIHRASTKSAIAPGAFLVSLTVPQKFCYRFAVCPISIFDSVAHTGVPTCYSLIHTATLSSCPRLYSITGYVSSNDNIPLNL